MALVALKGSRISYQHSQQEVSDALMEIEETLVAQLDGEGGVLLKPEGTHIETLAKVANYVNDVLWYGRWVARSHMPSAQPEKSVERYENLKEYAVNSLFALLESPEVTKETVLIAEALIDSLVVVQQLVTD